MPSLVKAASLSLVLIGLGLACGCAVTGDRLAGSWLSLPSPWATLQAADGNTSKSQAAARPRPAANDQNEESLAMTLLRGRNLERSGEWDKARKLYEELRDRTPDHPQIAHRLGVVADAQRRHDEAEHYFLAALAHQPRNAELLADLGYCYFLQGQLTKAESAAAKSVALEPQNSRYRNNLGLIVGHQGRYEEALNHFSKSGSQADAHYNLAFVFAAQDRVDEAKECFQAALNADPTHRQARNALASFHEFDNRPAHLDDTDLAAHDDGRWVAFQEKAHSHAGAGDEAVVQASAVTSRDASRVTRALHMESRGMLNRNMHGQRADEMAKQ